MPVWKQVEAKGLAADGEVNETGIELRQRIEDRTDELTTAPWEAVGLEHADEFARVAEPTAEILLQRVNETAGANYMPASRLHPRLAGRVAPPLTS